jgi:hypothetical protein
MTIALLPSSIPLLPSSAVAVVAWLLIRWFVNLTKSSKSTIPYLSFEDGDNSPDKFRHNTGAILEQGYEKYLKKGLPFSTFNYVDKFTPMVMLPLKYLAEVRSASSSKLSFNHFLNQVT